MDNFLYMNWSDRHQSGQVARWRFICLVSAGAVMLVASGGAVAEPDAPDCSAVDFDQNGEGYYEIGTLEELQCIEEQGLVSTSIVSVLELITPLETYYGEHDRPMGGDSPKSRCVA